MIQSLHCLANEPDRNIYIFGCGKQGINMLNILKLLYPERYIGFVDNDSIKQGTCIECKNNYYEVVAPQSLYNSEKRFYIILASKLYYKTQIIQLREIGISEENIVLSGDCLENCIEKYEDIINKRKPKSNLNFVVDLAEHCNLNCVSCDHFSPLAKEHFTDINQFDRDMKRIAEIFGEDITHVDLEGGEPLLNPDVTRYVETVHRYMPYAGIKIFSNGLLLPKMSEEFWDVLKKHNVTLEITQYPLSFDYEKAEALAHEHGVKYDAYGGKAEKVSWHKPLDPEGKQNRYDSFNECYLANGECTMLKNGKLYPCTLIPNIEVFNAYFGKNIEVTERDYIDIYSDVTKEEVYEFLCEPPMACRYCKVREWTYGHQWRTTNKDIREWT